MKTRFLFIALASVLAFASCKTTKQTAQPKPAEKSTIIVGDNSQTSLDWSGVYTGTLPCADCEGIVTTLTLNQDLTYRRATTYQGKTMTPKIETGKFTWDKGGSSIFLQNADKSAPNRYLVGENHLKQLDMEGHVITGNMADLYQLHKKLSNFADQELTGKKWKLVEMAGRPVSNAAGEQDYFIMLDADENRINGFAGCNNFFGNFELAEGLRIKFSQIASTMMACPDMNTEKELFQILETVDNYSVRNDILELNKARMMPMARFELVKE